MEILQVIINSIVRASELTLLSLGLTMVYDILKFTNLAHTDFAVIGVYLAFFLNVTLGVPIVPATVLASLGTGVLMVLADKVIFKPLRNAGAIILMVASLGLGIAVRNGIRAVYGATARNFTVPLQRPLVTEYFRITPLQIWIILAGVIGVVLFHLLLHHTKFGKSMRAASDNPELAQASGIATEKIVIYVWFIAAAFASLGSILIGLETFIKPYMGFIIIVPVFCATIVGGIGNPYGAMLGALLLGLVENFSLYINFGKLLSLGGLLPFAENLFVPTGYKAAISFIILILVLLIRPRGILGKKKEG
jgi:branched-subunit amino acid ABC-type transport system permease component